MATVRTFEVEKSDNAQPFVQLGKAHF